MHTAFNHLCCGQSLLECCDLSTGQIFVGWLYPSLKVLSEGCARSGRGTAWRVCRCQLEGPPSTKTDTSGVSTASVSEAVLLTNQSSSRLVRTNTRSKHKGKRGNRLALNFDICQALQQTHRQAPLTSSQQETLQVTLDAIPQTWTAPSLAQLVPSATTQQEPARSVVERRRPPDCNSSRILIWHSL